LLPKSKYNTTLSGAKKIYQNSSSVYFYDNNDKSVDTYHIEVAEAGNIEIVLEGNAQVSYAEGTCPEVTAGSKTISRSFGYATEFNLKIYSDELSPEKYLLKVIFTPNS